MSKTTEFDAHETPTLNGATSRAMVAIPTPHNALAIPVPTFTRFEGAVRVLEAGASPVVDQRHPF